MALFKPKAPALPPDSAAVVYGFRETLRTAPEHVHDLEAAISRVRGELERLRSVVAAGNEARDTSTLDAAIARAQGVVGPASEAWERQQRRYHGGSVELADVGKSEQVYRQACDNVRGLQTEKQTRITADAAQAEIARIRRILN